MDLKSFVRDIPDFPQPGVLFRDISPLLRSPEALDYAAQGLVDGVDLDQVDFFAGIESRGFILGMLLATRYGKGFLPIRKAGKLPPPVVKASYTLEYGQATLELNPGKGRLLVVDDVLATGGTLGAALQLCAQAGYDVRDVSVLIDLPFLNSFRFQDRPVRSVLRYD